MPHVDYTANGHEIFDEYRSAAEWCAKRGYTGKDGDPLPELLSRECHAMINEDPDAFRDEIRLNAYSLAMEKTCRLVEEV